MQPYPVSSAPTPVDLEVEQPDSASTVVDLGTLDARLAAALKSSSNPIRMPRFRDVFSEVSQAVKERRSSGER